jgi:transglutaminase-like putative cysteine protease
MIIDKPIAGVKMDTRTHPPGKKGAHLSLREVADRAWVGRKSPRVRAWATQALAAAGVSTGGRRQKGQAILDAFRNKVPYISDPVMGEFMATPEQTLCLDEGGLCIIGGDCDDAAITLSAAMMSIGIPAMIVGSSHKPPIDVPTHVYMAFQDDLGDWVKMDGTTKLPAGRVAPHSREWWVEPGETAKAAGEGDFVGMSGVDDSGTTDGALAGPLSPVELLYPFVR